MRFPVLLISDCLLISIIRHALCSTDSNASSPRRELIQKEVNLQPSKKTQGQHGIRWGQEEHSPNLKAEHLRHRTACHGVEGEHVNVRFMGRGQKPKGEPEHSGPEGGQFLWNVPDSRRPFHRGISHCHPHQPSPNKAAGKASSQKSKKSLTSTSSLLSFSFLAYSMEIKYPQAFAAVEASQPFPGIQQPSAG